VARRGGRPRKGYERVEEEEELEFEEKKDEL
jgi:hypothetical protein